MSRCWSQPCSTPVREVPSMPSATTGARARRAVPRLSAAALAAAVVLTGCAGGTDVEAGGEDDRFISGDGSATVFETDERDPVPDASGTTLDDDELSLSDYRGPDRVHRSRKR